MACTVKCCDIRMVFYDVVGYIRRYLDVGVVNVDGDIVDDGGVSDHGFVEDNVVLGYGL
jgi:hypothetical protein